MRLLFHRYTLYTGGIRPVNLQDNQKQRKPNILIMRSLDACISVSISFFLMSYATQMSVSPKSVFYSVSSTVSQTN